MPRHVRFFCNGEERRLLVSAQLVCPATLPTTMRGCPKPWTSETFCEAPNMPTPHAGCSAGAGQCCLQDGTVIHPCGPIGRPGCTTHTSLCGSGGFCHPCRCLPPDAGILTDHGEVEIAMLRIGDRVVSLTRDGHRTVVEVKQVVSREVLTAHEIVSVHLEDGRTVRGSGPHPLADGRTLGNLVVGDTVDGSRVDRIARAPFAARATWDILPAGETGVYFVGGVPLGSTLKETSR